MDKNDLSDLIEALNYDPDTGILTWNERPLRHFPSEPIWKMWNRQNAGTAAFATKHHTGFLQGKFKDKCYTSSQVSWAVHYHKWPKWPVGHTDLDRTNNRLKNLYLVTPEKISKQMRKNKRNKSGFTGVYFNKKRGKWMAFLKGAVNWNRAFDSAEAANEARMIKAAEVGFTQIHGVLDPYKHAA